jgi:hypothetical protein
MILYGYGTDFPNIPYAWDRELKWLKASGLTYDQLEWILGKSATEFFELTAVPSEDLNNH